MRYFSNLLLSTLVASCSFWTRTKKTRSTTFFVHGLSVPLPTIARTATASTVRSTSPILSAVDLMCLTNAVQHVILQDNVREQKEQKEDMVHGDGPHHLQALALENTLSQQWTLMQDRVLQLNDLLSTTMTTTKKQQQPPGRRRRRRFMAHYDSLSHMDYMCIVNQIDHTSDDDEEQRAAIAATLERERSICQSRMTMMEEALEELFLCSTSGGTITTSASTTSSSSNFNDDAATAPTSDYSVDSLLSSIQSHLKEESTNKEIAKLIGNTAGGIFVSEQDE